MQTVRSLLSGLAGNKLSRVLAAVAIAGYVVTAQPVATFENWQVGDVLAGVGDPFKIAPGAPLGTETTGLILRYPSSGGAAVSSLNEPDGWYTTGCAYYPDPTAPELWTTSFGSTINRYDPTTTAWTAAWIDVAAQSNGGSAESIAFAPDGSVFIGTPWSASGQILHYTHGDASSNTPPTLIKAYAGLMGGAADWIDVATEPNGDLVVYYTSENSVDTVGGDGAAVYKINITQTDATNANVETHITTVPDSKAWALRVLPKGQGVLVAATTQVFWLSLTGEIRKTYQLGGIGFFALNISPDGEYFWTATSPPWADNDGHTTALASIYKVHIATGTIVNSMETAYASVAGLCVVREYTAAFDTCTNDAGQPIDCRILEVCGNGLDDDGDGNPDATDPDCVPPGSTEICGDGYDNNHNGLLNEGCPIHMVEDTYGGADINSSPADPIGSFELSGLPPFLEFRPAAFDPTRLQIWGKPGFADASATPYVVTVTLRRPDGSTSTGEYIFQVENANRPPAFTEVVANAVSTAVTGSAVSITTPEGTAPIVASAADPDTSDVAFPDHLVYALVDAGGLPISINAATGTITPASRLYAGVYLVKVSVTDDHGAVATLDITWTITLVNGPPTIAPIGPQTSAEGSSGASVTVAASDPDGDHLTYSLSAGPLPLTISATGVITQTAPFSYSLGTTTYPVTVTVSDTHGTQAPLSASTTFDWTITDVNRPPTVSVPAIPSRLAGTLLTFAATATDPDGDTVTFSMGPGWPGGFTLDATTGVVTGTSLVAGTFVFPIVASDGRGGTATATATAVFFTNRPPVCASAAPSVALLWPPNHKLQPITIQGVTDADGDALTIAITSIFQDEPTNTVGDGDTPVDAAGIGTSTAWVRAERTGNVSIPGDGRVYHIAFTATDAQGASCTGAVTVGVPHDQGGRDIPIDGGALYDSLIATPGGGHYAGDGDEHDRKKKPHKAGDNCEHDRNTRSRHAPGDGDDHDRRVNGHFDGDGCEHDRARSRR